MKPFLPWLLAAVSICPALAAVRADDAAIERIRTAQTALANARAWRRTTATTILDRDLTQTVVAEAVQPDLFHYVTWSGVEYFSDGRRSLLRDRDGTVRAVEPENRKTLDDARVKYSLKRMLEGLKDAHIAAHENFRDLPVTVVGFTVEADGVVSTGKLWISDADHLPLKIESETHGEMKVSSTGVPYAIPYTVGLPYRFNQRATGSYEYGPSIQVVMP